MREILFRGKRIDCGLWVEGYYFVHLCKPYILPLEASESKHTYFFDYMVEVDPKTIGQYIGVLDKNNKRIFEDDIVVNSNTRSLSNKPHEVRWGIIGFCDYCHPRRGPLIIGNIHDNPELLEVQ